MKKIRILFVSAYLARNGTEAFMMNVFRNINKDRFHIDFLCFSREDIAYEEEIERNGSSLFILPQRKEGLVFFHSLKSFFKNNQYDVLHWCACSCTTIAPLYYAYKYNVPVRITHSHNSSCLGVHNKMLHYVLRPIMNILTTDRLACSEKASRWFFLNRKSTIIKNGIDIKKFSYDKSIRVRLRHDLNIHDTTKVIGHIGRFDPVKNHSFLLDIFSQYSNHADTILMLIGIGALEHSVREKVRLLHLEDKVLFLQERSDVPDLLQAMDLFIMPSLFEGLPFVLVEAQAAGLPCLVSDNVDPNVKITPYIDFLSINESPDIWINAMERMFNNYKRITTDKYMKNNGFTIDDTVKKLEAIYSRELQRLD